MTSTHPPTSLCFANHCPHESREALPPLTLATRDSEALAELLPVLICGEESAALAFARLRQTQELVAARNDLARIERDEDEHARLLTLVREALPPARDDAVLLRATRRFFLRMGERDIGRHFARIAALDSGVCVLLGALRRRRLPIASEATLSLLFARIHRDEGRHVVVARHYARSLIGSSASANIAADTRQRLVDLLIHRAATLEQLLHIDADKLFTRLRTLPRELFA
jgi:hypothetical protein